MTFNSICNVGILNVDFNWFLTCLDFKGFMHFSLSLRSKNRFIYGNNVNNSSYMHIYGFNLLFMCLFSVNLQIVNKYFVWID